MMRWRAIIREKMLPARELCLISQRRNASYQVPAVTPKKQLADDRFGKRSPFPIELRLIAQDDRFRLAAIL